MAFLFFSEYAIWRKRGGISGFAALVDIGADDAQPCEAADAARDPQLVLRDGVHPSLFGHQLIADEYLKYAGELFK